MTATVLASVAGVVLSLAFSYIPGLNTKYAGLSAEYKRLIMLALLAVVAGGVYGVSCLGWFNLGITCDKAGALSLLQAFVVAAISNQTAYGLSPQSLSVREVKEGRIK